MVYTNGVLYWHSFGLPWSVEDHTETEEERRGEQSPYSPGFLVGCGLAAPSSEGHSP